MALGHALMADERGQPESFDFKRHEQEAVSEYLKHQSFYDALSGVVARIIEECLKKRQIKVHSVPYRAKNPESFGRKASLPSDFDPGQPNYPDPLREITDLAGVRVIAYLPGTLPDIDKLLEDEFDVVERSDKSEELLAEDKFGYQSIHYLVRIKKERIRLAEYEPFANAIVEVQVRTILQHAWAEIEHDIQYKSTTTIPAEIHRRFMALAGMLEIADREFQAIQDADREQADTARELVNRDELTGVEITPQSLKQFLDRRLGSDGRISDWGYDWTTRLVKRLGFRDLKQVETAIERYDDNMLSTIAWGGRQGQTTRFELMLLAALGQRFIELHPWAGEDWFGPHRKAFLEKFKEKKIPTSTFDPLAPVEADDQPKAAS